MAPYNNEEELELGQLEPEQWGLGLVLLEHESWELEQSELEQQEPWQWELVVLAYLVLGQVDLE